jgi:hypothetical protein
VAVDPGVLRLKGLVRAMRELLSTQRSDAAALSIRRLERLAQFWEEALAQRETTDAALTDALDENHADLTLRAEVLQDCAALGRKHHKPVNLAAEDLPVEVRLRLGGLGETATELILDVERLDLCTRVSEERLLRARQRATRAELAELAAQEELTRCVREVEAGLGRTG